MSIKTVFFIFGCVMGIVTQILISGLLFIIAHGLNTYGVAHFSEIATKLLVLLPITIWLLQAFFFLKWTGLIPNKIRNSYERHEDY